ncbi:MAG: DUF2167 domain-containing protein [Chthoniobacterales bacterium]
MHRLLLLIFTAWMPFILTAHAEKQPLTQAEAQKIVEGLHYQWGQVLIENGGIQLNLSTNFAYLDAKDAQTVSTKLWGNPPNPLLVGAIVPRNFAPTINSWIVMISYYPIGYVKDNEAEKINPGVLLQKLEERIEKTSKFRVSKGYAGFKLIGWAEIPSYNKITHKLYWGEELAFSNRRQPVLNYDVRILGRHGVIGLKVMTSISQFAVVKSVMPQIVTMVNFQEANRYTDFDAQHDSVSGYDLSSFITQTDLTPSSAISFLNFLPWYLILLFSFVAHEASHALAALVMGDYTAYHGGQVSLNPLPHIRQEPFGTVILPLLSYFHNGWMMGWASAPYNPAWAARHPRRASLMAAAGPAANLVIFFLAWLAIRHGLTTGIFIKPSALTMQSLVVSASAGWPPIAARLLSIAYSLNLLLFIFNIIPLPPLDGAAIIRLFLPDSLSMLYAKISAARAGRIGGLILVAFLFSHAGSKIMQFGVQLLYHGTLS